MMLKEILEYYSEEEFLIADGFDEAVIGVCDNSMRIIYSVYICIEILKSQDMSEEEATDYFQYNVASSYFGEKTPIFCFDLF